MSLLDPERRGGNAAAATLSRARRGRRRTSNRKPGADMVTRFPIPEVCGITPHGAARSSARRGGGVGLSPSLFTRLAAAEDELRSVKDTLAEVLDVLAEMKASQDAMRGTTTNGVARSLCRRAGSGDGGRCEDGGSFLGRVLLSVQAVPTRAQSSHRKSEYGRSGRNHRRRTRFLEGNRKNSHNRVVSADDPHDRTVPYPELRLESLTPTA